MWTNACCGHPRPGEDIGEAATRRLNEEMGFTCALTPLGTLIYRAEVGGNLIEHELVHIFAGLYEGAIHPDPQEADDIAWRALAKSAMRPKLRPKLTPRGFGNIWTTIGPSTPSLAPQIS